MEILTLQHREFDLYCFNNNINDETVSEFKDTAFISIIGSEECRKYYNNNDKIHWFKNEHDNVLNLEFDDVTEDVINDNVKFTSMTIEQAKKCVDFIDRNKGKTFIVHCFAGISRSGAVSQFIYDFYNDENIYEKFKEYNSHIMPNNYVLTLLKRVFYEKNNIFK